MMANSSKAVGVRCVCQSIVRPDALSARLPCRPQARARRSGAVTRGNSDLPLNSISTTMPSTTAPSATSIVAAGSTRPSAAPAIDPIEAVTASGRASRRFASPARSRNGPAPSALANATMVPAPRTKSRWNGKKPPTIGTNSVPPPMPAGTATMPITKQVAKSAIGQVHQGIAAEAAPAAQAGPARQARATAVKIRVDSGRLARWGRIQETAW